MGKKAPIAPGQASISTRKAKAPAAVAAAQPAAEQAVLHDASALLENVPTEVLFALAKARGAAAAPAIATTPAPTPAPTPAVYISDDDYDSKPKARERISILRTEVQAKDSLFMQALADQTQQVMDGTLEIVESLLRAMDPQRSIEKFMADALTICQKRLKCFSVALKKAGPSAGRSFAVAYKIWHSKRQQIILTEFEPDKLDKTEVEVALARN